MTVAHEHIGPYELRGELGRGAMARVWRAWDPNLAREVAVKEPLFDPRLSQATLDEMARRFVAEARAVARLNHPNIVGVYATDVWDGRPAIVMELVEGETLAARLARGPLPADQALAILDQLLDAVGYAHDRGVVHRDIKPDNVFVTPEGVVKLADFGIAHIDGGAATHATVAGTVLGTPGYLSPEQARGAAVDVRSDLFSIGVVAYEMLAGYNPFGADGGTDATTLIYRIVHEPAPELRQMLPTLPAPVASAVMAALEKDPADRPQSADEFKTMLHAGKVVQPNRKTPAPKRLISWLPYVVVLAIGLVATAAFLFSALSAPQTSAPSAPQDEPVASTTTQEQQTTPEDELPVRASLAEYSWEELSCIAESIAACTDEDDAVSLAEHYGLLNEDGSYNAVTKDFALSSGKVVHMRLVGVWHDVAQTSSGKAGLSFLSDSIIDTRYLANTKTIEGGWEACSLRAWLNDWLWSQLPEEVSSVIVPVRKMANNRGYSRSVDCVTENEERLWLPSIVELCGPVDWVYYTDPDNSGLYNEIINQEGSQYPAFASSGIDLLGSNSCLSLGGTWWVRTLSPVKGNGRYVGEDGNPSLYGSANKSRGVVVGFCL